MVHSIKVDKNNVEILRFKRERVLFCFCNLSGGTVKKAYQIFPSLVYFYQFSFQFSLEKCRGDAGVWFGCFGLKTHLKIC